MSSKIEALFKSPLFLVIETLFLVGIPLIIALSFPQLLPYRLIIMALSLPYIYFVMKLNNISLKEVGLSKQNIIGAVKDALILSVATCLVLVVATYFSPTLKDYKEIGEESYGFPTWIIIPFYILVSVPLQEFILRGFYISRLELVSKNKTFLLIYSSFIFALIHSAFQNKLMVPLAFLLGLCLGHIFLKHRSLVGPMLAHAIIGVISLILVLS